MATAYEARLGLYIGGEWLTGAGRVGDGRSCKPAGRTGYRLAEPPPEDSRHFPGARPCR